MSHSNNSGSAPEGDSPAVVFIKSLFGPTTEQSVFLCTLPNTPNDPGEVGQRFITTREPYKVTRFIKNWDRRGRALYFCVGTVKNGQQRAKENILETVGLHVDIDFKDVDADEPDIRKVLRELRCPPSALVRSGHGLHVYWLFKEGLESQPNQEQIEIALRQLADLLAGDMSSAEMSRLLRLPGSHNTKGGEWREVICEFSDGPRYELDDLEAWLAETAPVLQRKAAVEKPGAAQRLDPADPGSPYLKAAELQGYKLPLDVEQALAAMAPGNIHNTIVVVSGSLIARGQPPEQVFEFLDQEVSRLKDQDPEWRGRRKEIREAIKGALKKGFAPAEAAQTDQIVDSHQPQERIINLGDERAARAKLKPKSKVLGKDPPVHKVVIEGLILRLRTEGHDILLSEGEVWLYREGLWHVMTPSDQQWLEVLIQEGLDTLNDAGKPNTQHAAWKRLVGHPELYMAKVPWAASGTIVCQNGVLTLSDGDFRSHAPLNYARRKIGAAYEGGATCPRFEALMLSMFEGRSDARAVVGLIQEWLGSALAINLLLREERKALLPIGASRSGKTELSSMIARLIGGPIAAPSVKEIGERFGLMTLFGASAWVRDDAINEGDTLDPQRFKTIVTGEGIDVERKNRENAQAVSFAIPVCLTGNSLPKARDLSDAMYNRSLVISMGNVRSPEEATALRAAAGGDPGDSIGATIWKAESAGILNWAIAGLHRLRARGFYDIPKSVQASVQRFKDDNNPVGEWLREAIEHVDWCKVSRSDLLCAYHGWQRENEGDEAKALGAIAFWSRLRPLAPWISDMTDSHGVRFIVGVSLTDLGLRYWQQHNQGPQLRGGSKGSSVTRQEVNKTRSVEEMEPEFLGPEISPEEPPF